MTSNSRADLIDELVGDLRQTPRGLDPATRTLVWLTLSAAFVVVAMLWRAPLRPGALEGLTSHLQLAAQVAIGLSALIATARASFRFGIPDPAPWMGRAKLALGLASLWAGGYLLSLVSPALEPSMLGKRPGCETEVLLLGLPVLVFGLGLLRSLAPLERVRTSALVGLAAGAIPALLMDVACMYVPEHNLVHHLGPVVGLMLAGALIGPLVLRRL